MKVVASVLQFLGSIGLFIYGMRLLSGGLQKVAGKKMENILHLMTKHRITGVLTGLVITAFVQSSSATTVMVVGFSNAGFITLPQAISVIMGANIGTTVSAWIVSIFGVNFKGIYLLRTYIFEGRYFYDIISIFIFCYNSHVCVHELNFLYI